MANRQKFLEQELPKDESAHPLEEQFVAEMNALVVKNAEEYYRTMMTEDVRSWNLRYVGMLHLMFSLSASHAMSEVTITLRKQSQEWPST